MSSKQFKNICSAKNCKTELAEEFSSELCYNCKLEFYRDLKREEEYAYKIVYTAAGTAYKERIRDVEEYGWR